MNKDEVKKPENPWDWKCCVCEEPADYKASGKFYCDVHWNFGEPNNI